MTQAILNGTTNGTQNDVTRAWRDMVAVATQRALDALDETLAERILKAQALVLDGHVTIHEDGHSGFVASSGDPELTYEVNGDCPCPDAEHNEPSGGLCKHRLAVMLYRKATGLLRERKAELEALATPTPAEAPISMNAHVEMAGHRVQVTCRSGATTAEYEAVAAVMRTALAQHAAAPAPELVQQFQEPALPAAPVAPICPMHQREMSPSKWGGWYCPSKMDDGQYCANKVKAMA